MPDSRLPPEPPPQRWRLRSVAALFVRLTRGHILVAAMDALFGAFRAYLEGTFSDRVFVVSFVSNVLIAAAIVFVGDQIGVGSQLSTGVVVVLGIRIFTNVAAIRRALVRA